MIKRVFQTFWGVVLKFGVYNKKENTKHSM